MRDSIIKNCLDNNKVLAQNIVDLKNLADTADEDKIRLSAVKAIGQIYTKILEVSIRRQELALREAEFEDKKTRLDSGSSTDNVKVAFDVIMPKPRDNINQ